MIKLIDVYHGGSIASETIKTLYELLAERPSDANISHQEMPTLEQHRQFVHRRPYEAWYLISVTEEPMVAESTITGGTAIVGAVYLTKQREVGIFIFKRYHRQRHATAALAEIQRLHPGRLLANVNPSNEPSKALFERLGARHIQNTYEL